MRDFTMRALTLSVAFGALLSFAPSRADAFCRTWSCDPTKTTCPMDPDKPVCPGGVAGVDHPLYWPVPCVGFSLNQSASAQLPGATIEDKQAAFQAVADQAFATWQTAACGSGTTPSLAFADLGLVQCDQHQYNQPSDEVAQGNANILVFRDDSWPYANTNNTLALTTLTFNVDSGEIYDADMEINGVPAQTHFVVSNTVGKNEDDLLSVLTHEAGHFLGMAHSEPGEEASVMYAQYIQGSVKRVLTQDDVNGVCAIYPFDRVNLPTCDPTPRHGYATQCAEEPVPAPGNCAIETSPRSSSLAALGLFATLGGLFVARRRRRSS